MKYYGITSHFFKIKNAIVCVAAFAFLAAFTACNIIDGEPAKKIALVSGNSIHYWGDHENELMAYFLEKAFSESVGNVEIVRVRLDKGDSVEQLKGAAAIVIFGEGESNHPFFKNTKLLEELNSKGSGIGIIHYALQFDTPEESSAADKLIGGHYDMNFSVNPTFTAKFTEYADHPAGNGLQPFELTDEWYFNIKFAEIEGQKITPIASAVPPDRVRKGRFGPHTGNRVVRDNMGRSETIAWVCENPNGTRGFGFTGGHCVFALANDNYRNLLVNLIAWIAEIEIPENGFNTKPISISEIEGFITKEKRPDYDSYIKRWKSYEEAWRK